jgi:hypothetical protein
MGLLLGCATGDAPGQTTATGKTVSKGEIADLVQQLRPPSRFAKHTPEFSVAKKPVTFVGMDGPYTWDFWIIKDHDKTVAVMPILGYHGNTIYLLTHDPKQAPAEPAFPRERWHVDTAIGSAVRTGLFVPPDPNLWTGTDQGKSEWRVSDDKTTLTLVHRVRGSASAKNARSPYKYLDHTGTFVLRMTPTTSGL